ncbi:MAG: type II toxin-antitoxin system VapC family toxin [Microlunatus sp.]|nr:type II toxin-antitoxin system VapC family toxin [Microlunatus sp.]MDN5803358.1 type II toxin-antitoxin system VapC family toxin [Microlunatus sp.]
MADESRRGLIDTNIVILRDWIAFDDLPGEVAISCVTLAELSAGPHLVRGDDPTARRERARRVAVLQRAENEFDPLVFDAPAARVLGQLSGAVVTAGRTPRHRPADLQIAATAVAHRLPLYPTNPRDYLGLSSWLSVVAVARPQHAL